MPKKLTAKRVIPNQQAHQSSDFIRTIKLVFNVIYHHPQIGCFDFPFINYIFVDYGQTDTGMAPFGKSTGIISTVDYIDNWNHMNKEDYNNKKKEIETIFTERLNELIPDVVDHIEHISVATPKTMERYTHNPKGSVIGFARSPQQVGMYPLTSPFKNLYFASAWSIPGGGFTSIIDAGWQVATSILKKRR